MGQEFQVVNVRESLWRVLSWQDAPVLILDEATSSLDILTEKRIVDNLMALDKTLIFIAHRLTIAERTEKVVVLDQGKIVEEGTHADLLAQGWLYAHLVNS